MTMTTVALAVGFVGLLSAAFLVMALDNIDQWLWTKYRARQERRKLDILNKRDW
jgi:hypothetical protein